MNEAVNQHIGGTKRRNKGDALDNDDAGLKASMGKKLPKEAVAFAKAMGISMDGIEAEAEDMWRMLTEMHERNPLEYHQFVQQQFDDAKEEGIDLPGPELPPDFQNKDGNKSKESKDKISNINKSKDKKNEGKYFRPFAGFAFKVKTDGGSDGVKVKEVGAGGKDFLINVCSHEAISPPLDKDGREVLDDRFVADGLQIPMIVGPTRDLTLDGQPLAVDVVLHPSVITKCEAHRAFQIQIIKLVIEWVQEETGVAIFRIVNAPDYTLCKNVYMGGRGERGETPVLFPVDHAMNQKEPINKRKEKSNNTNTAADSSYLSGRGNSSTSNNNKALLDGPTKALSNPSSLLNAIRGEKMANDESEVALDEINLSISSTTHENKSRSKGPLIQDLSEAPTSKSLIEEITSLPPPQSSGTEKNDNIKDDRNFLIQEVPKEPLLKEVIKPISDAAEVAARIRIAQQEKELLRKQKNSKPAIKKGFLNSSKNAGTLYPEGSGEGQGGATGGTYTRFMSKCQVVDTSTMSQEETEKAMQDYAGPQGNVKTKQSSTTTITSPSNLATSKPTATAAQSSKKVESNKKFNPNNPLIKQMEDLMGNVDDDWNKQESSPAGASSDLSDEEFNSAFADLAKALGETPEINMNVANGNNKGKVPSKLGHLEDAITGKLTKTNEFLSVKVKKQLNKIQLKTEDVSEKNHKGMKLRFSEMDVSHLNQIDLQIAERCVKVRFGDEHVVVDTPFTIKEESVTAKKSKKSGTFTVSFYENT